MVWTGWINRTTFWLLQLKPSLRYGWRELVTLQNLQPLTPPINIPHDQLIYIGDKDDWTHCMFWMQYQESEDTEEYFERLELFFQALNWCGRRHESATLVEWYWTKDVCYSQEFDCTSITSWIWLKEHLIQMIEMNTEWFKFHKWDHHLNETINEFIIELLKLTCSCDIRGFLDQALRDCSVCGLANASI